jgi:lysozyme family protein
MSHDFAVLEPEFVRLIALAHIRPECEHALQATCVRLLHDKAIYGEIATRTGVPIALLMALNEREDSGNLHAYMGNGQPLTRRTTIVPKGRGPFPDTPAGFVAGACDALAIDHLDQVARQPGGWSMPRAAYESVEWNGWGYGTLSPYAFGGTTVQKRGKYIRDHVYDPNVMDPQLGTVAIMEKLFELDPSLVFAASITKRPDNEAAAAAVSVPHPALADVDVRWVQASLNKLKLEGTPIGVDGDVGRETRAAVRAFEIDQGLSVDRGMPGPQVVAALTKELAALGLS